MKVVLATLSRHIYSGWALYVEGMPASAQVSEVTLDRALSHTHLTTEAMKALMSRFATADESVDLYVIDDRQRSGLQHPSTGVMPTVKVQSERPNDAMTRKARRIIEDKYHQAVRTSPFDGDPTVPFLISTAVEMHRFHPSGTPFGVDGAGAGWIIAGAGDIHSGRSVLKVPRHDDVVAELLVMQSALSQAIRNLPTLKSTSERAVLCTRSEEALDSIAYPWGGSKARRLAAGKVIEQLNKIRCGERREDYAVIFRLLEDNSIPYQKAAASLSHIASEEYEVISRGGASERRAAMAANDNLEASIRDELLAELGLNPKLSQEKTTAALPLFHFPDHRRKKGTLL